jgi:uncharacterized protein (DUF1778 family)
MQTDIRGAAKLGLDSVAQMSNTRGMTRTTTIGFRVTPDEKRLIRKAARRHHQTLAFYAKDCILCDSRTINLDGDAVGRVREEINRLVRILQESKY